MTSLPISAQGLPASGGFTRRLFGRAVFGNKENGGEALARFCFAKEDSVLLETCRRLEKIS